MFQSRMRQSLILCRIRDMLETYKYDDNLKTLYGNTVVEETLVLNGNNKLIKALEELKNTAGKEELMTLPGIGEAKAEKILRYREEHGAFRSIEDVMQIEGIKEGVFNKIKEDITI